MDTQLVRSIRSVCELKKDRGSYMFVWIGTCCSWQSSLVFLQGMLVFLIGDDPEKKPYTRASTALLSVSMMHSILLP
jgi:hypothetical protein